MLGGAGVALLSEELIGGIFEQVPRVEALGGRQVQQLADPVPMTNAFSVGGSSARHPAPVADNMDRPAAMDSLTISRTSSSTDTRRMPLIFSSLNIVILTTMLSENRWDVTI